MALGIRHVLPASHVASTLIGPVKASTSNSQSLRSLIGASPLASLAGRGLGGPAQPIDIFMELLRTPDLAERLQKKDQLLQVIFAKRWDAKTSRWIDEAGALANLKRLVRVVLNLPDRRDPDVVALADYIDDHLTITPVQTTGLYRLSFRGVDSAQTLWILKVVTQEADQMLREQEEARLKEYVVYLLKTIDTTSNVVQRQALTDLLLDQERELMVAKSGLAYAADVIEAPYLEARLSGLNPVLLVLGAGVVGFSIGFVYSRYRSSDKAESLATSSLA